MHGRFGLRGLRPRWQSWQNSEGYLSRPASIRANFDFTPNRVLKQQTEVSLRGGLSLGARLGKSAGFPPGQPVAPTFG